MGKNFHWARGHIVGKICNKGLLRIHMHTFRHFFATKLYLQTRDIRYVQKMGHRSITSTLIYTHLVQFEGDEYNIGVAKTLKEDEELLKAGFEYVTDRDGIKIYRKRK